METPNMRIGAQNSTGFSRVFVSEEKMTFSGGPNNRMQTQIISIHRCVASISVSKKMEPFWKNLFNFFEVKQVA